MINIPGHVDFHKSRSNANESESQIFHQTCNGVKYLVPDRNLLTEFLNMNTINCQV